MIEHLSVKCFSSRNGAINLDFLNDLTGLKPSQMPSSSNCLRVDDVTSSFSGNVPEAQTDTHRTPCRKRRRPPGGTDTRLYFSTGKIAPTCIVCTYPCIQARVGRGIRTDIDMLGAYAKHVDESPLQAPSSDTRRK